MMGSPCSTKPDAKTAAAAAEVEELDEADIEAIKRRPPGKKPWLKQIDGDLNEKLWCSMIAKNPMAVQATKVKGHCTVEHISPSAVQKRTEESSEPVTHNW